mmetsp:Transcript_43265/g.111750  ORF Transcript_43265/g.111750 Transcript_43265/m.111750 type:complete len:232 (-) Transcript_43265:284-979(-)
MACRCIRQLVRCTCARSTPARLMWASAPAWASSLAASTSSTGRLCRRLWVRRSASCCRAFCHRAFRRLATASCTLRGMASPASRSTQSHPKAAPGRRCCALRRRPPPSWPCAAAGAASSSRASATGAASSASMLPRTGGCACPAARSPARGAREGPILGRRISPREGTWVEPELEFDPLGQASVFALAAKPAKRCASLASSIQWRCRRCCVSQFTKPDQVSPACLPSRMSS